MRGQGRCRQAAPGVRESVVGSRSAGVWPLASDATPPGSRARRVGAEHDRIRPGWVKTASEGRRAGRGRCRGGVASLVPGVGRRAGRSVSCPDPPPGRRGAPPLGALCTRPDEAAQGEDRGTRGAGRRRLRGEGESDAAQGTSVRPADDRLDRGDIVAEPRLRNHALAGQLREDLAQTARANQLRIEGEGRDDLAERGAGGTSRRSMPSTCKRIARLRLLMAAPSARDRGSGSDISRAGCEPVPVR